MAAAIITTAFADTDKALRLGNHDTYRPLSWGAAWTSIRIGLLMRMTPDGTNALVNSALFIGTCVGPRSFTNAQSFAVGQCSAITSTTSWTYNAGGGAPYMQVNSNFFATTSINGTKTQGADANNFHIPTNTGTARRGVVMLELLKTSSSTITTRVHYQNAPSTDFSLNSLYGYLETNGVTPSFGGVAMTTTTARTITMVGADQIANMALLDTVNVSWNRDTLPVEIYACVVRRMR